MRVPSVAGALVGAAAVSLVVPATLSYDPWAWLVWGREVTRLDLATVGGPSWKPLPVVATTLLSGLGSLAPTVWLLLTRLGAALLVVAVWRLAARVAGRMAGAVAVALLFLTPDGDPRFVRLVLEGHTAPLAAAVALWAVDRHLAGRPDLALLLGTAVALDRPEAWPLLALYACWLWRARPSQRALVALSLPAVPLLWFGGDWLGSGSPWHGAHAAQVIAGHDGRAVEAVGRVFDMVVLPAWLAAAVAVVDARRRRDGIVIVLASGALAWCAVVVAMSTVFGYAALSRFLLPAAAVVCVLAGIGTALILDRVPRGRARAWLAVGLLAAALPFVVFRVHGSGTMASEIALRDRVTRDLDAAIAGAGGREALLSCGRVAVDGGGVPRLALAWKLDVPLAAVRGRIGADGGVLLVADRQRAAAWLTRDAPPTVSLLARSHDWSVLGFGCRPVAALDGATDLN